MELKQLEYFVRVAELSSFTRAAHTLNIAQPALSRAVRMLAEVVLDLLAQGATATRAEDKKEAAKPYPLVKCIVSDEKLGEMGKPYVFTHEGQDPDLHLPERWAVRPWRYLGWLFIACSVLAGAIGVGPPD